MMLMLKYIICQYGGISEAPHFAISTAKIAQILAVAIQAFD
jgi:hypothetical protein